MPEFMRAIDITAMCQHTRLLMNVNITLFAITSRLRFSNAESTANYLLINVCLYLVVTIHARSHFVHYTLQCYYICWLQTNEESNEAVSQLCR